MGYYTRYEGSVSGPKEFMDKFEEDADNGAKFGEYEQDLDDWLGDLFGGETVKWYGWKKDLEDLSAKYPFLLFELEAEGEESGDIWKAFARNGKVVTVQAEIKFRTPDLDKELPTPDITAALAKVRDERRRELDAEIARLETERAALDFGG